MNLAYLYPLSNYSFGNKEALHEDTPKQRLQKLPQEYQKQGVRTSVEGLIVVHEHSHPHVLMLQTGINTFKLPGDTLSPGEDEIEGLKKRLDKTLSHSSSKDDFEIGELLGMFYRPNFDNVMFPYCPAHIKRPKEIRKVYLVHLPEKSIYF